MSHAAVLMVAVLINPLDRFEYHKKDLDSESSKGSLYFPPELIVHREFQIKKPHFTLTSRVSRLRNLAHSLL